MLQLLTSSPSKLQYQKCRDTFKKSCFYEYKKVPQQHNIEICNDNLRRDCGKKDGQEICTTEYVTGKSQISQCRQVGSWGSENYESRLFVS